MKQQYEFNMDQKKILHLLYDPSQAYPNLKTIVGVSYKRMMEITGLSIEKTLLSLGWLEALGIIRHDVGMRSETIKHLGSSTVIQCPGQTAVRLFSLTDEGKEIVERLLQLDH